MKMFLVLIPAIIGVMAHSVGAQSKYDRLPGDVTPETAVVNEVRNRRGKVVSTGQTTVEKLLNEMKARYRKGVLVDGKGREIRFFEPLCRGASAGFEQDQKAQKEKDLELAALRKKYTVIRLLCDPRVS